jgi:hypothetical protein
MKASDPKNKQKKDLPLWSESFVECSSKTMTSFEEDHIPTRAYLEASKNGKNIVNMGFEGR